MLARAADAAQRRLLGPSQPLLRIQLHGLALGTFASLVAPFGGFFASGIKRAYKIKVRDARGPIGHGGCACTRRHGQGGGGARRVARRVAGPAGLAAWCEAPVVVGSARPGLGMAVC